jgi:hypothetical protein
MQAEWPPELVLEYLIEVIRFSRRMGNYLFLPLFVVFAFCSVFAIGWYISGDPLSSRANYFIFFLTMTGFVLWWLTRKPSAGAFLGMGLVLSAIGLAAVSIVAYRFSTEEPTLALILQIPSAAVWVLGTGRVAVHCFCFWRDLRHFHQDDLAEAYRIFQAGTGFAENSSGDSTTPSSH